MPISQQPEYGESVNHFTIPYQSFEKREQGFWSNPANYKKTQFGEKWVGDKVYNHFNEKGHVKVKEDLGSEPRKKYPSDNGLNFSLNPQ